MKKIITEDLLQQIRLMNYDRSKTLQEQEQEFNNIRLLKEDCVQSMAMIDPKTGKGVYVDSVTGKPCTPKTPSSTKIVKKDNPIKPLWNTNIKEFVFPAYVEYLDVPKDKERHATQAALAQQQGGIRKEPVILIKRANGYELLEGWHRTIQHFAAYPQGYTGPAWVTVGN